MTKKEFKRFNERYQGYLRLLKFQGKAPKTIDAYSRAVRWISEHFNCRLYKLTQKQLQVYFGELLDSLSWITVKVDRLGLNLCWKHELKTDWQWADILKPYYFYNIAIRCFNS
ncbi:MAG: phage integrase N-terminal SAM-like domain-containing protein [Desulfobacterales bacterium]|nr:phage integrase N-terminal SAM-like domain-containing protein [Desulfobacterales bacterium]